MPYKEPKIEKLFYSISEVAEMFNVNTSKIRYYENQFDILKPRKNKKGNRMFTKEDIDNLKIIFHLIDNEGVTIKGAIAKMSGKKTETSSKAEVVLKLENIRKELQDIYQNL